MATALSPHTTPRSIKDFKDAAMAARFLELGILPGDEVQVIGRAPFNGAIRVETKNGVFALRKEEWDSLVFDQVD